MSVPNPPATGTIHPPAGRTRLLTSPSEIERPTAVQKTDARRALTVGLAEYLEQLEFHAEGGRRMRFEGVHSEWAEPEEQARYPSAVVVPAGAGTYAPRSLTPSLNPQERLPAPDGRYLVAVADYEQLLNIEVWANGVEERSQLVAMLEQALFPVFFRSGFVLELPHYFNARGTYLPKSVAMQDSEDNALRRYRIAVVTVAATVPLIRLFGFLGARPVFSLETAGPQATVLNVVEVT